MTARPDYDVVIVGGGLAGLSLAVRLAAISKCRTAVIEPRFDYPRDRTWSYWRLVDHPFREAVTKSWSSWEVIRPDAAGSSSTTVQTSRTLPYDTIPSDRLYAAARRLLEEATNVDLRLGIRVVGLDERPDRVYVETSSGRLEAGTVFDSRPPPPVAGDLVQRFLGQEVTVDRPVFDPGRLTLMDFAVPPQPGAVHFLYVLPTSPTEALVEDTWLAPAAMTLPDYRGAIRDYLASRYGVTGYAIGFEEEGAIPMSPGLQAASRVGRIVPIGTAGGAVKPSSGYGFLGIQRAASALAADIAAGRPPMPYRPRNGAVQWMDAVFLTALRRRPEAAPHIFQSMFAGCRPEPLIRFLNDLGSPLDALQVMAAMPKLTMIAAARAHVLSRSGA